MPRQGYNLDKILCTTVLSVIIMFWTQAAPCITMHTFCCPRFAWRDPRAGCWYPPRPSPRRLASSRTSLASTPRTRWVAWRPPSYCCRLVCTGQNGGGDGHTRSLQVPRPASPPRCSGGRSVCCWTRPGEGWAPATSCGAAPGRRGDLHSEKFWRFSVIA